MILQAAEEDAANKLVSLLKSKNEKIALMAAQVILDRTMGKPMQAQNVQLDVAGLLDVRAQIRTVLMEKANEQRRITGDNNT